MSLIIDKPEGLRSSNDLDAIPTDILDAPPAYLWFGTSPCAVENPPEIDEVRTYIVRVRCTGKTEKERTDGEMRHGRQLSIQACWESGKQPPNTDDDQPGLFDEAGNPNTDDEDQDDLDDEGDD
ncbi:hypothetical protein [Mycobacterium palustre]|uniref:Uncharacterized protein n=1 Tax=Mycobacterium palustre TaxID=153971 RepID=A0A1X1ZCE7_9MYCO|nr:hypothetical protein [Mycobacterium palustre]MCV7100055.1 hypothetical protein [Mycobacterium palustre]ORW20930.1 hypothetical protein AWC19_14295 [Mycobacterium palustre]